ncbi:MAG TPA: fructosamine kinase family protein [Lentimicrobium sp.]|nr:fructosamine kinase family protein [Lentimicrobium sp.]
MLSPSIKEAVKEWLHYNIDPELEITGILPLSGGSINDAYRLKATNGDYFIKINKALRFPGMFETELEGLKLLDSTETVYVPKVYYSGSSGEYAFILLNYEIQATPSADYWTIFAQELASLHKVHNDQFGLGYDNYIGSLHQSNKKSADLYEFMVLNRFQPLVRSARDNRLFNREDLVFFDVLYKKLPSLIPYEEPSLLHGDLWSGNLIMNSKGNPCLIDPAVYYGHRETDIAMTKLFGGFPAKFYHSYNSIFPMESGWEDRIRIHQLYPLLVHVNLFGESYSYDVRRILKYYTV